MGLGANARIISARTLIIENNMYILVALALSLVQWFVECLRGPYLALYVLAYL